MANRKVERIYQRVGPALFARAQRALKDPTKAEVAAQQVVLALSQLGELDDEQLIKVGRELLKATLAATGTTMDSMTPDDKS